MANITYQVGNHDVSVAMKVRGVLSGLTDTQFTYTFKNFFHPFVGELIAKLNRESLPGMLDAKWQDGLTQHFFKDLYNPTDDSRVQVKYFPKEIDVSEHGPYANYNWELFFHIPLTIAVHLSKTQRFAEAQRWFHYIFDPTCNNTSIPMPARFWKFLAFGNRYLFSWDKIPGDDNRKLIEFLKQNFDIDWVKTAKIEKIDGNTIRVSTGKNFLLKLNYEKTKVNLEVDDGRTLEFIVIMENGMLNIYRKPTDSKTIDETLRLLSTPRKDLPPKDQDIQDDIMNGYDAIRDKPFQPHVVAKTRHLAYQYCVVMKYLDNLVAWGDHLFQQDTVESINEATQIYVLAANILGERPQRIPPRGTVKAKTFAQLKEKGLGPIGDALVEMEGQFPFNLAAPNSGAGGSGVYSPLFGIGRTLYFCIPRNDKLLGYWDTVADRLFKIRHCMNIAGVVRPLALFDPPIDPGMLVKAAAAGIDISSIVSGLNQPVGPVRSLFLIQKALELCGEVRGLGNALLSALEKGDAENLALIRQRHEIQIQKMAQDVRFLQWKSAQEATTSLLTSRKTALERLHYYQRLLSLPADQSAPEIITLDRRELTEENFDEAYTALVGQYEILPTLQLLPKLTIAGDTSPAQQSGASGKGRLYLNASEDAELNSHLPRARDSSLLASAFNSIAAGLVLVPDPKVNLHFWGLGGTIDLKVGKALVSGSKIPGDIAGIVAGWEREQAGMASKTASNERRADEWIFQYNLAAHELMQIGRQILTSLIAEKIAKHEYDNVKKQFTQSNEVLTFLLGESQTLQSGEFVPGKFSTQELYGWMQGELFRLYYEYYRFAFDTARKAERTMKQELMRPEVDAQDFVKFNYWDGGRKGLLSGEALYLDVKRMEMSYHENNKRELELTKHVSLGQLNPVALLTLKATGKCQVTIPEWLYDLDCPGHYMRRIKSIALSIPSVVGPYTSINCTMSLLKSSLRKSPVGNDYMRQGSDDDRFVDYIGAVQSIVTSGGVNDSGLFETNLRDERFLPFEGAGAESTWKLELSNPKDYPSFDYATISDVILHIRYTARQGVDATKVKSALVDMFGPDGQSNFALLFSLRHDFPNEWSAFVNSTSNAPFAATIRRDYFPYFIQGKEIKITSIELYGQDVTKHHTVGDQTVWDENTDDINDNNKKSFTITAGPTQVLTKTSPDVFLIIRYSEKQ